MISRKYWWKTVILKCTDVTSMMYHYFREINSFSNKVHCKSYTKSFQMAIKFLRWLGITAYNKISLTWKILREINSQIRTIHECVNVVFTNLILQKKVEITQMIWRKNFVMKHSIWPYWHLAVIAQLGER